MRQRFVSAALALAFFGGAFPAIAQADAEKADELMACDTGAAAPLDPAAAAPPVSYFEIHHTAYEVGGLDRLAAFCRAAIKGEPQEERFKYQLLRVRVLAKDGDPPRLAREVRSYAARGLADAHYLLFRLYVEHSEPAAEVATSGVTRDEGIASLRASAEAGHMDGLSEVLRSTVNGPYLLRDVFAAFDVAERMADLPPQGPGSRTFDEEKAVATGQRFVATLPLLHDGFPRGGSGGRARERAKMARRRR